MRVRGVVMGEPVPTELAAILRSPSPVRYFSATCTGCAEARAGRFRDTQLASRSHELVYGGASVGLMGHVARGTDAAGGRVTGIIPRSFAGHDLLFREANEIIMTD